MTTINPTPEHRQELRALLAKAEQAADDVHYFAGPPTGYMPHTNAYVNACQKAVPALLDHIERLEAALRDVQSPLTRLKREADANGHKLSGQAYQIAHSLAYVQDIARLALSQE